MRKQRTLSDAYRFPEFRPATKVKGVFGDSHARILRLERRGKKTVCGVCGTPHRTFYDQKRRLVRDLSCGDTRVYLEVAVRRVLCRMCQKVKREALPFLADNPFYTKRFAFYVGRRCRSASIKAVARELRLDWHTVKALDKQYMQEQLRRAGAPGPRIIGIDEISIRKGHTYRIVVSDLLRRRPIWFGGTDRSEASLACLLRLGGTTEESKDPDRGYGHVEGVCSLDESRTTPPQLPFCSTSFT